MKSLEIKGKIRQVTGKKDSKKLRTEAEVPGVLYGGEENIHFCAPFSEFRPLVYTPEVFVVNLNIEGKIYPSILQDMQWHPVEEQMLHADFLLINEKKPMRLQLPVSITGTAKGIKVGGKLKVNMRKIKVKGLVKDLPEHITADVTDLDLGHSLKVGDLHVPGVHFLENKSTVIAQVVVTRASKTTQPAGKESKK